MWLLSTDRAELHFFTSPDAIDGGYAILSHTWDEHESTFQDVRELKERCQLSGENPLDLVSSKIRHCCVVAARDGFRWVWIDTCCIDKTSSTELSEAINSMFRWYAESEVCYAFLADVPVGDVASASGSAFRRARWHKRGWTLQELIAPIHVVFLSRDWTRIGNKTTLTTLLEEITSVPAQVLTREVHFHDLSIAERMSWASMRVTTRAEDKAYCLMGLFNVNMPTIYGEGQQAFRRLQEEIMKQSIDSSLFVWGDPDGFHDHVSTVPFAEFYETFNSSVKHIYLLAPSPRDFHGRFREMPVQFTPNATSPLQPYLPHQWTTEYASLDMDERKTKGPFGIIQLPKFSMTSYGVKCRFPIAELGDGYAVAVLLCNTEREHIGLLLHPSNLPLQDPTKRRYNVGYAHGDSGGVRWLRRLLSLGGDIYNLTFNGKPIKAEWQDIYIVEGPPPARDDRGLSLSYSLNSVTTGPPPFRVPRWIVRRLASLGMEDMSAVVECKPVNGKPFLSSLMVENRQWQESLWIVLGTCTQRAVSATTDLQGHWAKAVAHYEANWGEEVKVGHDCAVHHIAAWPGRTKTFGDPDAERSIRLSFTPCRFAPDATLVLHLELDGDTYSRLRAEAHVSFPPLAALEPPRTSDATERATPKRSADEIEPPPADPYRHRPRRRLST